MKTKFYLDYKKATRKQVIERIGKERLEKYIKESAETFREDPYIENAYYVGGMMLTIEFTV